MTTKLPASGFMPPAEVDLEELEELSRVVNEYAERELVRLRRDERLLRNLHTFYGPFRPTAPANLTQAALTRFADLLRVF